jgi:hypothetical protein
MSIIEIILGSDTAYLLGYYSTWSLPKCNPGNSKKRYHAYYIKKNVILVLHILVCTKWIVYLDLWWNIGYLQGPPRDGAYGYIPLNIPPRAPSRTPRLNNMQIYIEIYCYSTRHQGTMLHEMSSICSCDIPPRVWGREARHQGRKN